MLWALGADKGRGERIIGPRGTCGEPSYRDTKPDRRMKITEISHPHMNLIHWYQDSGYTVFLASRGFHNAQPTIALA